MRTRSVLVVRIIAVRSVHRATRSARLRAQAPVDFQWSDGRATEGTRVHQTVRVMPCLAMPRHAVLYLSSTATSYTLLYIAVLDWGTTNQAGIRRTSYVHV